MQRHYVSEKLFLSTTVLLLSADEERISNADPDLTQVSQKP